MMTSAPNSPTSVYASSITVTLTDSDVIDKSKKNNTVYKVAVTYEGRLIHIQRKYSEFGVLFDKVRKLFPDADLKLPAKKFFGNLDPNYLKHRREGLNEFVRKLVSHPGLCQNPDVRAFLALNTGRACSTEDEDDPETDQHSGVDVDTVVDLGDSERPHARPSDFEFLKVIGKGSFGKVLVAKHKTEEKMFAVKVLNKSHIVRKNETKHIMSERNVLVKNVHHPFLVGLHYSFQTADKLYFVLDYVNGGELFFHLQKERCFSEARAKFYAAEIASALGYLHSLDIIYRDLKPENILIDSQGHVVLTDFGLCKEGITGRETTSTFCGTPEYLAPEVIEKSPYDRTVDWWCLGAVLYEMMFGLPPFYSRNVKEMYDNILHKPLRYRSTAGSSAVKQLLEGLLQKQKEKRLGAKSDFLEIKSHPFFSSLNWKSLDERKIKPPYNPNLSGQLDLKHFDPDFTREPVPDSVGRSVCLTRDGSSIRDTGQAFEGFSYVQPTMEDFGS